MTALPTLRPATADDVEAVAELWHRGWHDGHAGHVPAGLTRARTRSAFGERVPGMLAMTTVAEVAVGSRGRGLVPNPDIPVQRVAVRDHWVGHRTSSDANRPYRPQEADVEGGREVAGFVTVVDDEVEQLFVAGPHRGTAVAGTLLDEAERQVAAQGYGQAWLAVVAGNARARRFYERRGWADGGDLPYEVSAGGATYISPCRRYLKRVR
jgi:putative acetyltransferase